MSPTLESAWVEKWNVNPNNPQFIMENPNLKWMMNRGIPILGNPIYVSRTGDRHQSIDSDLHMHCKNCDCGMDDHPPNILVQGFDHGTAEVAWCIICNILQCGQQNAIHLRNLGWFKHVERTSAISGRS